MKVTPEFRSSLFPYWGKDEISRPSIQWIVGYSIVLSIVLFIVLPALAVALGITDLRLLPMLAVVLALYGGFVHATQKYFEGGVSGLFVLAMSNADLPVVTGPTRTVDLEIMIADPLLALFGGLAAVWIYRSDLPPPRVGLAGVVFGVFVAWTFVSAAVNHGPSRTIALFMSILYVRFFLAFMIAATIAPLLPVRAVLYAVAAAAVANAVWACAQALNQSTFYLSYLGERLSLATRDVEAFGIEYSTGLFAGGFVGDRGALSTMTVLVIPLLLYTVSRYRLTNWRGPAAVLALLPIGGSLAVSQSDTAVVATIGVITLTTVFIAWGRLPLWITKPVTQRPRLAGLATAGALGGLGVVILLIGVEGGGLPTTSGSSSFGSRLHNYAVFLRIALDYPIFGIGGGNAELVSLQRGATDVYAPHSFVVATAAEYGFVGLGLLGGAIIAVLWRTWIVAISKHPDARYAMVLLIGMLAYWGISFWGQIWTNTTTNLVFWLLGGMMAGLESDYSGASRH